MIQILKVIRFNNICSSFFLFYILFSSYSYSQNTYTLDQCIDLALNNKNLFITHTSSLQKSEANYKYGLLAILPSISTSGSYNINNGRKLDVFTNTFGSNTVYSSTFYVSSQLYVFQGFRYIKQNQLNRKFIENNEDILNQTKEKVKLQVVDRFVSIWKTELKIKQQEIVLLDLQKLLNIQKELIFAGKISGLDTLQTSVNLKSQKINLLNYKKERNNQVLFLNYLMGKSLNEKVEFNFNSLPSKFIKIEEDFQLTAIENQLEIVKNQYEIAISQLYPSLSLSGFKNTGYSSNNKNYALSNEPVYSFDSQMKNNQYEGIGLNLNIPVFNKGEYFKQKKLYQISRTEQESLLENVKTEKERRIIEIQQNKNALNEIIQLNESILADKRKIYEMNLSLYEAGKIKLNDVEKAQNEYVNFQLSIEDLKVDLFKLNLFVVE